MISRIINEIIKILIYIFISSIIGSVILILVYCLPTTRIKRNVASTSYSFNWEGIYPEFAQGYSSSILDNDTDAVMLATAAASVDNPIIDAMIGG